MRWKFRPSDRRKDFYDTHTFLTLVLIKACVAALAFYREWFHMSSDNSAGKPNVTVTVDKTEIQEDKQAAREKANDLAKRP